MEGDANVSTREALSKEEDYMPLSPEDYTPSSPEDLKSEGDRDLDSTSNIK
jgi:hypothetical protein